MVALLGHELQHAAEVADAPDVQTVGQFAALYRRIGVPSGAGRYDSRGGPVRGPNRAGRVARPPDATAASRAMPPERGGAARRGGSIAMP